MAGKHSPYLLLNGTTATIVVGIGATPGDWDVEDP